MPPLIFWPVPGCCTWARWRRPRRSRPRGGRPRTATDSKNGGGGGGGGRKPPTKTPGDDKPDKGRGRKDDNKGKGKNKNSDKNSDASEPHEYDPEAVKKSEEAQKKAYNTWDGLAKSYEGKTVSADGAISLSGWGRRRRGFQKPNVREVFEMQEKIGHPRLAYWRDNGVKGRYFACHAERQLSLTATEPILGVSRDVCPDCQKYFSKLAQYEERDWYVTDPSWTWIFHSDGAVTKLPRS